MRISDWSSDVCSSDLLVAVQVGQHEIQDDLVVIVELSDLKAVLAHIGRVAHIALRTEHHLDALGSGGIVLDKQNSHGGDLAPEWFPRFIINQFAEAMLRNSYHR